MHISANSMNIRSYSKNETVLYNAVCLEARSIEVNLVQVTY